MRALILALAALSIAGPAGAKVTMLRLPLAPVGMDYVESVCTGGIDGRYEITRVQADGRVLKMTRRSNGVLRATAQRGEVATMWRTLRTARFFQRNVAPEKPYVMDGINCSLMQRLRGQDHSVMLMQQVRGKPQYRDLAQVLDQVNAIGRRATGPILRQAEAP